MWPPTGLIPWFSKTEGNTYATLLHHPFLFKEKPTQCSRGSTRPRHRPPAAGPWTPAGRSPRPPRSPRPSRQIVPWPSRCGGEDIRLIVRDNELFVNREQVRASFCKTAEVWFYMCQIYIRRVLVKDGRHNIITNSGPA